MCLISNPAACSRQRRSPDLREGLGGGGGGACAHTLPEIPGGGSAAPPPGESTEPRTLSQVAPCTWY